MEKHGRNYLSITYKNILPMDVKQNQPMREKRTMAIIDQFVMLCEVMQKQNDESARLTNLAMYIETSVQGSSSELFPIKEGIEETATDKGKDFDILSFYEKLEFFSHRFDCLIRQYAQNSSNCGVVLERIKQEL